MTSPVHEFDTRNKFLTAKLLRQGYRYHKFYRRRFDIESKHNVGLKYFLSKAFQNLILWRLVKDKPNFMTFY